MRQVSRERAALNRGLRREAVAALYEVQPYCLRCGRADVELAGHERLGRAQGGNPAEPDCLVCSWCNTIFEDVPVAAAFDGWKFSRKHDRDPELTADQARDVYGRIVNFPIIKGAAA